MNDHEETRTAEVAAVAAVAAVAPTAAVAGSPPGMTVVEVTALVTLFNQMLGTSTSTILAAMAENSRAASERWQKHDADRVTDTQRVVDRFTEQDRRILTIETTLETWLAKEHDEDVAMDARIRPITGTANWVVAHWTQIALVILFLATMLNLILNSVQVGLVDPTLHHQ